MSCTWPSIDWSFNYGDRSCRRANTSTQLQRDSTELESRLTDGITIVKAFKVVYPILLKADVAGWVPHEKELVSTFLSGALKFTESIPNAFTFRDTSHLADSTSFTIFRLLGATFAFQSPLVLPNESFAKLPPQAYLCT